MPRVLAVLSCLALLAAAPRAHADALLKLTPAQHRALGVRSAPLQAASNVPIADLPAVARAPLEDSAVVTTPFEGITVAVLAREGQSVRKGQTLARIQSREAMRLGSERVDVRGRLHVAEARLKRERKLLAEGIIPASRVETARALRNALAARWRELAAAGDMAPQAANQPPGIYALRAPMSGRVIERDLRLGESVKSLQRAFVVAVPGRVMLEMLVPAHEAVRLHKGIQVRSEDGGRGVVEEIGGTADPRSQTVRVRALVTGSHLLPGMHTTATLLLPAAKGTWQVPSAAVAEYEGRRVVFVVRPGGFEAVRVQRLAQTARGQSVIRGALGAKDRVAVAGVGALKAMLLAGN